MKKNTIITKLPPGKIMGIKQLPDYSWEIEFESMDEAEYLEGVFGDNPKVNKDNVVLIDIRTFSLDNELLKWKANTPAEKAAKALMEEAIRAGVRPFFCTKYDPGRPDIFDRIDYYSKKDGNYISNAPCICFKPDRPVARAESCEEWVEAVGNYMPSYSRIGTELEYGAFLLVLMTRLLNSGKSMGKVWDEVCNDSKELGHYRDSKNAAEFSEMTGSRYVAGFYDLGNCFKLLTSSQNNGDFFVAGGCYTSYGAHHPISDIAPLAKDEQSIWEYIVPWVVFSCERPNVLGGEI